MKPRDLRDQDWGQWGDENPYYGVLSHPKFLSANLTGEVRDEFFETGTHHVEHLYSVIRSRIDAQFPALPRVLDFGCGVGRLLIPFARYAQTVAGVDISPGMLKEAKENCERHRVHGVRLLHLDELDSLEPGSFDLVHSYIVFQHIPVARGEHLFRKLILLIAPGGVGAIHLTFSDVRSRLRRAILRLRSRSRLTHGVINRLQGKPFGWPLMQMNSYSMNRIFNILMDAGCFSVHVEFQDHGGFRGAMLYFKKNTPRLDRSA
jgi:SAM-dependent methyltransferase